mmetsp:Transcript_86515/g.242250  ORF Transcript_86515/g.242250 Transcript_86515/m.242250 type:complete len:546 (+) Transcript_86515:41-1678(+)
MLDAMVWADAASPAAPRVRDSLEEPEGLGAATDCAVATKAPDLAAASKGHSPWHIVGPRRSGTPCPNVAAARPRRSAILSPSDEAKAAPRQMGTPHSPTQMLFPAWTASEERVVGDTMDVEASIMSQWSNENNDIGGNARNISRGRRPPTPCDKIIDVGRRPILAGCLSDGPRARRKAPGIGGCRASGTPSGACCDENKWASRRSHGDAAAAATGASKAAATEMDGRRRDSRAATTVGNSAPTSASVVSVIASPCAAAIRPRSPMSAVTVQAVRHMSPGKVSSPSAVGNALRHSPLRAARTPIIKRAVPPAGVVRAAPTSCAAVVRQTSPHGVCEWQRARQCRTSPGQLGLDPDLAESLAGVPDSFVDYLVMHGVCQLDVYVALHDTAEQHRNFWERLVEVGEVIVDAADALAAVPRAVAAWRRAGARVARRLADESRVFAGIQLGGQDAQSPKAAPNNSQDVLTADTDDAASLREADEESSNPSFYLPAGNGTDDPLDSAFCAVDGPADAVAEDGFSLDTAPTVRGPRPSVAAVSFPPSARLVR